MLIQHKKTLKAKSAFQLSWLNEYDWLAYSPCQMGAYCLVCTLFSANGKGGGNDIGKTGWTVNTDYFLVHKSFISLNLFNGLRDTSKTLLAI